MWVIWNRVIPFGSFEAMAVWPFVFVRRDKDVTARDIRHEKIHCAQQLELLEVGFFITAVLAAVGCGWWSLISLPLFYWAYAVCWLIELVRCLNDKNRGQATSQYKQRNIWHRIAHSIIFEREAYAMQNDTAYLNHRPWFAWIEFIGVEP